MYFGSYRRAGICIILAFCTEESVGDFNCRLGQNPDALSELLPDHCTLAPRRNSRDHSLSARGRALRNYISEEGFIVVNGRSPSDPNGDFTFVAPTGRSLVDLFMCNILSVPLILDAGIVAVATRSDHFPIFTRIHNSSSAHPPIPAPQMAEPNLRWRDDLKYRFNSFLRRNLATVPHLNATEFISAVQLTATDLQILIN